MLVSLLSATIPYSFYNIRAGVNDAMKFTVATLSGGSSSDCSFTIDAGNYTATSLRTTLQTQTTAECTGAGLSQWLLSKGPHGIGICTEVADRE